MNSSKTIQIDADRAGFIRDEAHARGTLYPGMIVKLSATADVRHVRAHDLAGGGGLCNVVIEDALQGRTVSDAYVADGDYDLVQFNIQRTGTRFQALLKNGENVVIGDELVSDGAGRLVKADSLSSEAATEKVLAYAEEDVDLTVSDAEDSLIVVRAA